MADYNVGDKVRVIKGKHYSFVGKVDKIESGKVTITKFEKNRRAWTIDVEEEKVRKV